MKYIIMCGGNYPKFEKRKQLLEVNGEILVERTIRLLQENGVKDIAISTNCNEFNYLGLPILMQENKYVNAGENENKKSEYCWLNAYQLLNKPCCHLYGDVYYSDEAIKTIVETKVKDTMFFCVRDLHDGRPTGVNAKGREPLAYKVENYKMFNNAVKDILKKVDDGVFINKIAPFSWHLYRYINGFNYITNDLGYINNIFTEKGDYIVIDDYSTDIDNINDIAKVEKFIKMWKGGIKMVRVEVIEEFYLGRFNELKNIVRKSREENGRLFKGDIFECTEEMAEYLTGKNATGRSFVKLIEIIPEKVKEEAHKLVEQAKEKGIIKPAKEAFEDVEPVKPKRRRRTIAKKD